MDALFASLIGEIFRFLYNGWIDLCLKAAGWDIPFGTTKEKYSGDRSFFMGISLLTLMPLIAIFGWLGLLFMIIFYTLILVIGASIHKYWKEEKGGDNKDLLDN